MKIPDRYLGLAHFALALFAFICLMAVDALGQMIPPNYVEYRTRTPSQISTPGAGKYRLYIDGGLAKIENPDGTTTTLSAGGGSGTVGGTTGVIGVFTGSSSIGDGYLTQGGNPTNPFIALTGGGALDGSHVALRRNNGTLQVMSDDISGYAPVHLSAIGIYQPGSTSNFVILQAANATTTHSITLPGALASSTGRALVSSSAGVWSYATGTNNSSTFLNGAGAYTTPIGFVSPMTTAQDLIVGGASGVAARLGVGTNSQVLTVSGGNVVWATPSGGGNIVGALTATQFPVSTGAATIGDSMLGIGGTNGGTVTVRDTTATTGSSLFVVRAGAGQAAFNPLFDIQAASGASIGRFNYISTTAGTMMMVKGSPTTATYSVVDDSNYNSFRWYIDGAQAFERFPSDGMITWAQSTSASDTPDVGIKRGGPGILSITLGASGNGALSTGTLQPATTNTYDLGMSTQRWLNVHTRNAIFYGSSSGNPATIQAAAATASYNFILPPNGGTADYILRTDGTGATSWVPQVGGGTVSSVGMTVPSFLSVTPASITTSGTFALTLNSQTANTVFAAPSGSSGAPTFRALVSNDINELLSVTDLSTYTTASGTGLTAVRATFTGLVTNDVLTWNGTNWINQAATGGGAPTGAQYIVSSADGTLSAERVVTDTATVAWDTGTASQLKANVPDGSITLAKMANVATARLFGRVTAATGVPEALTGTQATTLLDVFTSSLKGLAPASGGGTSNFLRADGTWAVPAGGGGGSPGGSNLYVQVNNSGAFGGFSSFTFDSSGSTTNAANLRVGTDLGTALAFETGGGKDGVLHSYTPSGPTVAWLTQYNQVRIDTSTARSALTEAMRNRIFASAGTNAISASLVAHRNEIEINGMTGAVSADMYAQYNTILAVTQSSAANVYGTVQDISLGSAATKITGTLFMPAQTSGTTPLSIALEVLAPSGAGTITLPVAMRTYANASNYTDIAANAAQNINVRWLLPSTDIPVTGEALVALSVTGTNPYIVQLGYAAGGGSGTVTSVGLAAISGLTSVSGSPVTTTGTLTPTLTTQLANTVFAGATSGGAATPTFRALVLADIDELEAVTDLTTYASVSGTGTAAVRCTFTSLTTNDVLTWNGTNWINQAPSGGGLTLFAESGGTTLRPVTTAVTDFGDQTHQVRSIYSSGGFSTGYSAQTGNYTLTVNDTYVSFNTTATATLPAAASNTNRVYHIKNTGTSTSVTIDANASELIDGALTIVLSTPNAAVTLVCDGTGWLVF